MPSSGSIRPYLNIPVTVRLGFKLKIPYGHGGVIIPRGSAGTKYGLTLANTTGLIDPDYTGEWILKLLARGPKTITWVRGDRLCQFSIVPMRTDPLIEVTEGTIETTERGDGAFQSTGLNTFTIDK